MPTVTSQEIRERGTRGYSDRVVDDGPLSPARAPVELCEFSADARAAVLLDGRGELAGSSEEDAERAQALAELTRELFEAVEASLRGERPDEVEAQVERGSVYAVRGERFTLAAVARRSALSSLMLYDMRSVLARVGA